MCWFHLGQHVRSILCVAYSICSISAFIYSKNPYDNSGVERLVKREKCWQTANRGMEGERKEREWGVLLWNTSLMRQYIGRWNVWSFISGFWEKYRWKVSIFEMVANMIDDKSQLFCLFFFFHKRKKMHNYFLLPLHVRFIICEKHTLPSSLIPPGHFIEDH